jgi:hypothetical protein
MREREKLSGNLRNILDKAKIAKDSILMQSQPKSSWLWTSCGYHTAISNLSTEPTACLWLAPENPNCGKPGMFSLALPLPAPVALRHPVFSTGSGK